MQIGFLLYGCWHYLFSFFRKNIIEAFVLEKTHIKNYMDFANRYEKLYLRKGRSQFRPKGIVILP